MILYTWGSSSMRLACPRPLVQSKALHTKERTHLPTINSVPYSISNRHRLLPILTSYPLREMWRWYSESSLLFFIRSIVFSSVTRVTYTSKVSLFFFTAPPKQVLLSIFLIYRHSNTDEMASIVTFGTHLLNDEGTDHFSSISSSFGYFLFQKRIFRSFASFKIYHCYYYHSFGFFVKLFGAYVILDISS